MAVQLCVSGSVRLVVGTGIQKGYGCAGASVGLKQTGQGLAPQYCRRQRGHVQRTRMACG
ncbi:hypothetical protein OGW08_15720 [Citrobacter sp. Cf122]|uniref:hypothetical protein n=1 Tax=Citrobacter sp. Cf122 TaxID=2985072 RepID=UPI0025764F94|nr:hypothetical protein [Citrobacter sp. Cf122]MDM3155524.1 hypothetical protein [Citrobacter sp. Cf122]